MRASCTPTDLGVRTGDAGPASSREGHGGAMTTVIVLLGFFALLAVVDLLPSAVR
ncbi:hypothetical protein [Klenkia marina]|uniref:hypothetical protein n=1 Tax=Klenkia marina TaxID=1960309 RepID=UPI001401CD44|nr:hypothetical protein [Klenkia marina]